MLGGVIFFGGEAIFVSCSKAARPTPSRPFLAAPRKGKGYTLQAGGVVGGLVDKKFKEEQMVA